MDDTEEEADTEEESGQSSKPEVLANIPLPHVERGGNRSSSPRRVRRPGFQEKNSWKHLVRAAPLLSTAVLGLAAAIILFGGWNLVDAPTALTGLALLSSFFFISFERYVNRSDTGFDETDSASNNRYYPNLKIWGYGVTLGVGSVIVYLLSRVVVSSADPSYAEPNGYTSTKIDSVLAASDPNATPADSTFVTTADVPSPALWHDGLLLFFLSAALALVMYALVNITRSTI